MTAFGELLRHFRHRCNDPTDPARRLSQEKLGELLGMELGDRGFSGAAVSDWERSVSKIHADQRQVLTSLVKVLYEQGGIRTLPEANQLLESGNYRALNLNEIQQILPGGHAHIPRNESARLHPVLVLLARSIFLIPDEELQIMLIEAEKGPSPSWPHVFVSLTNRLTAKWSMLNATRSMIWIWVWLLCWALMAPSLNWPFNNWKDAESATIIYGIGALVIPLLIGLLTHTRGNKFWEEHSLDNAPITRIYTHHGASIGYHLGYFAIFSIWLFGYYVHVNFTTSFQMLITTLPLILGYIGARLVPYNLWQAYGRLSLRDGWIFFIFFGLGPMWGLFFYRFHSIFLSPDNGALTILLATTFFITLSLLRHYRKNR